MRKFIIRMSERRQAFMQGRYGNDELNRFLSVLGLILLVLSLFTKIRVFYYFALIVIILSIFRTLSRNIGKRQNERERYLAISSSVTSFFELTRDKIKYRKTYRYFKCPSCKAVVRIRKPETGKKITITCPRCANRFDKKV